MASFGPIAPFYDELMGSVPYEMWAEYYLLLLCQQDVQPHRILDVCCGTGNVTECLARRGYRMAGVDLSEPMIVEAKAKAASLGWEIDYLACDAASFRFETQFDAAYSFFDSFNYITDLGHLGKSFARVSEHLRPGASFIFDLNTAYAFEQKMFDQQDTRKKSKVQYKWKGSYNESSRIIKVNMDFWVEGQFYQETHIQRAHTTEEIIDLLDRAGFGDICTYDSYTLDPPRTRSDRIHFTSIRK
ncbi:MAG: class I SAM-dependent methyltransferase [Armatimonadetes bacterium]|nr:class I SAM-dependent methyltransferase [Armatimonadota bacterium]